VELALLFACPKQCGDGVCAMDRITPEDEEDCSSCPEDCGQCFDQIQCNDRLPLLNESVIMPSDDPSLDSQWHLTASHVIEAWEEYRLFGQNVTVAIVDDGLQWQHEDLQCNYNPVLSYDVSRNQKTVYSWEYDNHGTSCAGLVGARDNSVCGRGAAFRSTLVGLRALGDPFTDEIAARALSWHPNEIDIYSNSWGPYDNGATIERYPLSGLSVKQGIQRGRNGLGNIYVWAAGNGRSSGDSSNYDELCNSIFTISVAATDSNGVYSTYSEAGSNILINAPSSNLQFGRTTSGIVTTDRLGFTGYHSEGCFTKFGGTSAAAPLAAGIVALVVQANPRLTWRDVQHVLVQTAEKTETSDSSWTTNAAGYTFSPNYGFGRIHTKNAIEKAHTWKTLKQTPHLYFSATADLSKYSVDGNSVQIPEDQANPLVLEFNVEADFVVEHIAVEMSATKGIRGQIVMAVVSPSGTVSVLAPGRGRDYGSLDQFPFTSVEFWGEPTVATRANGATSNLWTVILYDKVSDITVSTLDYLQFSVYGLPKHDVVTTFEGSSMDITELLSSSYSNHVTLVADTIKLHWSLDGLYGEWSLALEVAESAATPIGYITLAIPMTDEEDSPLDVWVFYFDEEGHVEDRFAATSGTNPVLDTTDGSGQEDLRVVYAGSRARVDSQINEILFLFERSLNTRDSTHDAILEKDDTVNIYWSYGAVQTDYSTLNAPLATGKVSVKLMESTYNPPNVFVDFWKKWRSTILLGAVCMVVILAGGMCAIGGLLWIARKRLLPQDQHVELHESDDEMMDVIEPPSAAAESGEEILSEDSHAEV